MFHEGDRPVPGYRLERFLGRGQFGEVWAAEGPGGTMVALKFIALHQKTGIRELKSIQAVKRVRHANLCSVNAMWLLGQDGTVLDDREIDSLIRGNELPSETLSLDITQTLHDPQYLVVSMALADGSLDQRLKEVGDGGIPRVELLDYIQQAARGLDFLNAPRHHVGDEVVGIQHRDIKPANLLFAGDSVLVGDFGVASAFGQYDTEATSAVGSLCYMAPESIQRIPSQTSDQYALAITYYQLRTGCLPFEPTVSFAELVDIHVRGKLNFSRVTPHERAVLVKATSPDPKSRYTSCVEFAQALAASPSAKTERRRPAWRFPAMMGGSVAAVLLVSLLWMFPEWGETPSQNANMASSLSPYTLIFSPDDTRYEIEILSDLSRPGTTLNGLSRAALNLAADDVIRIRAHTEDPFFQQLEGDYTIEQLTRSNWHLNLMSLDEVALTELLSEWYEKRPLSEVRERFARAIDLRPALASTRPESQIALGSTPLSATFSPKANILGIAMAEESRARLQGLEVSRSTGLVAPEALQTNLPTLPRALFMAWSSQQLLTVNDSSLIFRSNEAWNSPFPVDLGLPTSDIPYRQLTCAALSPDTTQLAVGRDDGLVQVITLSSAGEAPQITTTLPFEQRVSAVGFTPGQNTCFAIDLAGNLQHIAEKGTTSHWHVSLEGEEVVSLHPLSESEFYAFTDQRLLRITLPPKGNSVEVSTLTTTRGYPLTCRLSGKHEWLIFSTDDAGRPLTLVDLTSRTVTVLRAPEVEGVVEDFVISADNRYLVYAQADGTIKACSLTSETPTAMTLVPSEGKRIKCIRLAASDRYLIAIDEKGSVARWHFIPLLLGALAAEPGS